MRTFMSHRTKGVSGLLLIGASIAGCAAMDPQGYARQNAPNYYNRPYDDLSAEQKMRLENHLAKQSNDVWRTSAQVTSALGRLMQGAGVLVDSARH
jgi:hypothetical protein